MSKKNQLNFIAEKKSRAENWEYAGWIELATLHSGFSSLKSPEPYQMSLHVVAIASCIEAFSRACFKILIDGDDSPYLERAKNFRDLTFDFELTKALSRKEITFGDLVSHNVGVSSADQIIKHFNTLFEGDTGYRNFKDSLSTVREFIEPPEEAIMDASDKYEVEYGELIVNDANQLICDIQDIFSARHIAAHEANFKLVTVDQLRRWFESAMTFATATHEIIEQKLRPGASRAAFGSSVQALQNSGTLYFKIGDLWRGLVEKWEIEWRIDETNIEKLWATIKDSEEAFAVYLEKEIAIHYQRVGMITGNGYRHLEAKIQKILLESKVDYLKRLKAEV
ncbi:MULTISPECIES: hypothetical protein [Pseudomonas]|uniref:hypothetical protein n=1 Tax=Pseudomonas TaxID=286 RepID=UPI000D5C9D7A|nr:MULTISPECIES: hypothetical protein [Pseudomonas]